MSKTTARSLNRNNKSKSGKIVFFSVAPSVCNLPESASIYYLSILEVEAAELVVYKTFEFVYVYATRPVFPRQKFGLDIRSCKWGRAKYKNKQLISSKLRVSQ